jgi:acetate kinase
LTKPESKVKALVVPTNEELVIARETMQLVNKK